MKRNYPEKIIDEKFSEARKKPRKEMIYQDRKKNTSQKDKVRLIFTHNRGNPPLHMWLREAKQCLVKNEKAKLMGDKMKICFSQPKNLKRIVTQKKTSKSTVQNPGCYKCGRCRVSCQIIKEGGTFISTNTRKTYKIRQNMDCTSSYVIYLGTFKKCGGQYVRRAKPL